MARYPYRRFSLQRWIYVIVVIIIIGIIVGIVISRDKQNPNPSPVTPLTDTTVQQVTPERVSTLPPETPSMLVPVEEPEIAHSQVDVSAEPNDRIAIAISAVEQMLNDNPSNVIEARDRLNELLPLTMSPQQRQAIKALMSQLSEQWLFGRTVYPEDKLCGVYKVQKGDLLQSIAKRNKVPYQILMEINSIYRPEALRAGERIKVIHGPFHARVYRSTFTLDLYLQNTYVRSFPVGLGKPGMETPTGMWVVEPEGKLISPTWTDPISGKTYKPADPDYPLGSRWIALEGISGNAKGREGFAIHGTKEPDEIGKASSQGCIRLHNGNAVLMYNMLVPSFSMVEVVE